MRLPQALSALAAVALLWAVGCAVLPQTSNIPAPPGEVPNAESDARGTLQHDAPEAADVAPPVAPAAPEPWWPIAWGLVGFRGFASGAQVAPNGVDFKPLFSLDLNFNLWLWKDQGLYAFSDLRFWGQRAAPGITNPTQGAFDFSKREFDFAAGVAWNYYGPLEARAFSYSDNNLNRGTSLARPAGFKDGVGLENRWYVGGSYGDLGLPGFDVARATFISVGYYPTKDMVDADGNGFKPGPFARAYLTYDLFGPSCYLFTDVQAVATQSFTPKLVNYDAGAAWRPFERLPLLEFRLGSEGVIDLRLREANLTFYGAARVTF
jgi:hypothetical protein